MIYSVLLACCQRATGRYCRSSTGARTKKWAASAGWSGRSCAISQKGLPAPALVADTAWHTLLRSRAEALAGRLANEFGLEVAGNLGQRLSKKKLEARPLLGTFDLAADSGSTLRTSTVHKVKGESLDAVLYIAKKSHVRALLDGLVTEEGRIGYVALTRARDLFVLAVPDTCLAEFEPELRAAGLQRVG